MTWFRWLRTRHRRRLLRAALDVILARRFQTWTCRREGYPCSFCANSVNFKGWGTPMAPYLRWRGRCQWDALAGWQSRHARVTHHD